MTLATILKHFITETLMKVTHQFVNSELRGVEFKNFLFLVQWFDSKLRRDTICLSNSELLIN